MNPEQKTDHESYESLEDAYRNYLEGLGFQEEDLRGKRILDVGAGSGQFVEALQQKQVASRAVSFSRFKPKRDLSQESGAFIQGVARELPCIDNSFDMVVSMYALPQTANSFGNHEHRLPREEAVARVVRECLRVVRPGGEIRFGGVPYQGDDIDEAIHRGVLRGIQGQGEMLEDPLSGNQRYIIKKT